MSVARNAVITGASGGIGLELCRQLAARGVVVDETSSSASFQNIFAVCRKSSAELDQLSADTSKNNNNNEPRVKILTDSNIMEDDAGKALENIFGTTASNRNDSKSLMTPIHLLIHNAGAYGPPEDFANPADMYQSQTLESITSERLKYSFDLNAVAPLMITQALLPNLRAAAADNDSSKIIIISSLMGSITDNESGGHYAYRAAKAAVNMMGKSLAADLRDDGVAVGLIHPGMVYTNFGGTGVERRPGQRDVDESVRGVLEAIDQVTMDTSGCFLHGNYGEGVRPLRW